MSKVNGANSQDEGRVIMFAGKGGVGKTTCAAATAIHLASEGKQTLAISTDPTPSLSHIFETNSEQKPVQVLEGLFLNELGMDEVTRMWDKKFGPEVFEVFSSMVSISYEEFADFITSILPGMRDEFMVDFIKELSQENKYDRIVWDTAPLGQTLGLLQTPSLLHRHLKPAPRIYSRLKLGNKTKRPVLNIIKGWKELSADDMGFLRNDVSFNIVAIPEALAVQQLDDIFAQLDKYGFRVEQLIINNVIKNTDSDFLRIKAEQQKQYINLINEKYGEKRIVELPLLPLEIKGVDRLRIIEKSLFQ